MSTSQGCVSFYKPRELDFIPVDDYWTSINGEVQIAMEYNMLDRVGSHKYAKMEKKHKVSLVFLTFENTGLQEWDIFNDLVFTTHTGDTIIPFSIEPAMHTLIKPLKGQSVDEEEEVIEVEFEKGWLWESIELINFGSKGISHVKFAKDMAAHYLENRVLLPGMVMKGYLGLPVPVGTPIEITLRKKP